MDFLYTWTGMGVMAALLVVLVVVLFVVRQKPGDDE